MEDVLMNAWGDAYARCIITQLLGQSWEKNMYEAKQLFDFMLARISDVGKETGLKAPQAFPRWFAQMYFQRPQEVLPSDGAGDAKIDTFFHVVNGKSVEHFVVNSKFTESYNKLAPVAFYDELERFWQAFANKVNRSSYLKLARPDLRPRYRKLFDHYDGGKAHLVFLTNYRRNPNQYESVKNTGVEVFHLEEIMQFVVDYIEDAMPETPPLLLTGINTVLSADKRDSSVPTSIVFARLVDFVNYMREDPYELLFARNIRLDLGATPVNKDIRATFEGAPQEFVFSNNGITMLCKKHTHDPGSHEVRIENPRIVNGSQTLHSIRDAENPPPTARVMVRIIQIPPVSPSELSDQVATRKDIIEKISLRSNTQNDIKKWNLVSNDDFQHELARFFRTKKLFYERRAKEWVCRQTELKSVGVQRGPTITKLTQLVAAFHWGRKELGPAIAKSELGELFEGKAYDIIKSTSPELAYQIHLVGKIAGDCVGELSQYKKYVAQLASHMKLAVFSMLVKALQGAGAKWGHPTFTALLEKEIKDPTRPWLETVDGCAVVVRKSFVNERKRYKKMKGKDLTPANFFKAQTQVARFLSANLPIKVRRTVREILSD